MSDTPEYRKVCTACGHIDGAHLSHCRIAELERELAAALKAKEEAERDAQRLTAIEENNWFIGKTPTGQWKVIEHQVVSIAVKPKLRDAIDAAMKP